MAEKDTMGHWLRERATIFPRVKGLFLSSCWENTGDEERGKKSWKRDGWVRTSSKERYRGQPSVAWTGPEAGSCIISHVRFVPSPEPLQLLFPLSVPSHSSLCDSSYDWFLPVRCQFKGQLISETLLTTGVKELLHCPLKWSQLLISSSHLFSPLGATTTPTVSLIGSRIT